MYSRQAYRFEKPVLYNNVNVESLYGASLRPENIAHIAPLGRRVLAGSLLSAGERLFPGARLISPYEAGSEVVTVSNPSVFRPGDVLRVVGNFTSAPYQESAAVSSGSAPAFGTVEGIIPDAVQQVTTLTPSNVQPGNIFILLVSDVSLSCVATSSSAREISLALKSIFDAIWGQSSGLPEIRSQVVGDDLVLTHQELGEIFEVRSSVLKGDAATVGRMEVRVTHSVGQLVISPANGNTSQDIGAKIRTLTDIALGVIANEHLLTDDDGVNYSKSVTAYNKAPVFTKALPYLDGAIIHQLPGLSFIPVYGWEMV